MTNLGVWIFCIAIQECRADIENHLAVSHDYGNHSVLPILEIFVVGAAEEGRNARFCRRRFHSLPANAQNERMAHISCEPHMGKQPGPDIVLVKGEP